MKKYLDLVPISAKVHRRQSRMTRICIVLAVFLVAVMFGLADMYLQGALQKELQAKGNWHYRLSAIDPETAVAISARPDVKAAGWHRAVSAESGYEIHHQSVALSGQDEDVFRSIFLNTLSEGTYPRTVGQAAVSSTLKENLGLKLGDVFHITKPNGGTADFTVVGFVEDSALNRLDMDTRRAVLLTADGLNALAPESMAGARYMIQFSRLCDMSRAIADIKAQNQLRDGQVEANESLLGMEGQLQGGSVNQIYQVALGLSILVMLTSVLMISSSMNSNVAQRTQFFGLLRCQGATPKQIMRFVRREGLHWCKTAVPMGIALSIVVVWILCTAMRRLSPSWFGYMPEFGVSIIGAMSGGLLGLLTVLLSARTPAKRAARVSPLEAVSGHAQQAAPFRKAANTSAFKVETALGVHHATGRKRNYLLMTGAFAICTALFLTFSILVDFMENAFMPSEWAAELSVVSESNTCSMEGGLLESVRQNQSVKRAYGRMFAYDIPVQIGGRTHNANLISFEDHQFDRSESSLIEGSTDPVRRQENQVLVVASGEASFQVGDEIVLTLRDKQQTVTVAGILSDSPLAREAGTETILCSEKTFSLLTGESGYTILDIQFKDSASQQDVEAVKSIFAGQDVEFTDSFSELRQQRNLYHAFAVLVYGFLSIIVAITVFHIMNTVDMGASARTRQYAAMRAIGMSGRQMVKMVAAEAATYAAGGIALGCALGLPLHWVFFVSLITTFWGIPWSPPLAALGMIAAIVLMTTLLSVLGPARRLRNLSMVDPMSAQ